MKKGLTVVSLVIVTIVMTIIIGTVIITGINSDTTSVVNTFALELLNIQNSVDEYYYRYQKYPSGEQYLLDVDWILDMRQFSEETVVQDGIKLNVVDLSLIGIKTSELGKGEGRDVYVLSESTGIVYYIEGIKFEDKVYYTFTDELSKITDVNYDTFVSAQDTKVYDVIFRPSTTEYTKNPITVKIKLPKSAVINSIVTTNNKSVSEEQIQGLYKQIEINKTSADNTGNYKITVNYTYKDVEKTAEYEVTNYNADLPEVKYTETINGNLKTVNVIINNNNSKIKTVKYEREIISSIEYFENYGKKVTNNRFVIDKDASFTIYVETESGINLMVNNIPEDWTSQIVDVVDSVPIPKGFVASSATGENTKNGGLVIYEGTEPVTDENVEDAKRTRNQYVWVPVEDFKNEFVREAFNREDVAISNTLGSDDYWEVVLDTTINMPLSIQDTNYITSETLAEVQAMYKSVKEYKGFYIARYEVGIDKQVTSNDGTIKKVYSVMGKIPYTYLHWTKHDGINKNGAVEIARSMYPKTNTNYGVVSTLTYGVQWDRTLAWWLEVGAKDGNGNTITSVSNSTSYGNYYNHVINSKEELNDGAVVWDISANYWQGTYVEKDSATLTYPKASGFMWGLSTGALKVACVNNIYDMAGNFWEWTMEGLGAECRGQRGGCNCAIGYDYPVSFRRGQTRRRNR